MPALTASSSPGAIVKEVSCVIGGILMIFSIKNPLTKLCPQKTTITSTVGVAPTTSSAVLTTSSVATTTMSVGSTTNVVLPGGTTLSVPATSTSLSTTSTSTSTSTPITTSYSTSSATSTSSSSTTTTSTSVSSTSSTITTSADVQTTTSSTSSTSTSSTVSSTSSIDVPSTTSSTSTTLEVPVTTSDAETSTTSTSTSTSSSAAPTSTNYSALSCPADLPLSCSNTTAIADTCCFESPGGLILQTQFWDTAPAVGPNNSWTVHGLWPDNCDGTYQANCDPSREYTNISQILQASGDQALLDYMNEYWLPNSGSGETFWEHEWGKHGTCMSTFDTQCYPDYTPTQEVPDFFEKTVQLFKTLPTYDWLAAAGIYPSTTIQYNLTQFIAALQPMHGAIPYIGCSKGQVDELWYFYHIQGSVQTGKYVPTHTVTAQGCPASFYYYPKGYTPPVATTTTKSSTAAPTATSASMPFVGRGFLYPSDPTTFATLSGPVTKAGKWIGGIGLTPAGWTTNSTTGSGTFSLTTSAGPCSVDPVTSLLSCAAAGTGPVSLFSGSSDGLLMFNGSTVFGAPSVPASNAQVAVYAQIAEPVPFVIKWSSVDLSKA